MKNDISNKRMYVMRHAAPSRCEPELYDVNGGPGISSRGREEALSVIEFLSENNIMISSIFTSPKIRARETAEVISEEISGQLTVLDELDEFDLAKISKTNLQEKIQFILKSNLLPPKALIVTHGALLAGLLCESENRLDYLKDTIFGNKCVPGAIFRCDIREGRIYMQLLHFKDDGAFDYFID